MSCCSEIIRSSRRQKMKSSRAARSAHRQDCSHRLVLSRNSMNSSSKRRNRKAIRARGFPRMENSYYLTSMQAGARAATTPAVPRSAAEPRIINPIANARYEIDPVLPHAQQMIELIATLGPDVKWFVNDKPQLPETAGRYFWPLTPGQWKLRAASASGTAEETIFVE